MRGTRFGLLLIVALSGCARWAPGYNMEAYNGFSRQWLSTDSDAQSRTDTLIEQSQSEAKQRVGRQQAAVPAKTRSADQELTDDSSSDK
ncbi:MAG TPA: hypothetical protein VHY91_07145 [Pirellulales bacterium]|nr:hypothetical protein [Pirellulales bacterium]